MLRHQHERIVYIKLDKQGPFGGAVGMDGWRVERGLPRVLTIILRSFFSIKTYLFKVLNPVSLKLVYMSLLVTSKFADKAGACPCGELKGTLRLGWKQLTFTNTLAYYVTKLITAL
jgi:hypothetical protein